MVDVVRKSRSGFAYPSLCNFFVGLYLGYLVRVLFRTISCNGRIYLSTAGTTKHSSALLACQIPYYSILFIFCFEITSHILVKRVSEQHVPELPYQDFFVFSFQDSTIKISDHTIKHDNFCITLIGYIFMQASYGRGYLFSKEYSVSNQSRLE